MFIYLDRTSSRTPAYRTMTLNNLKNLTLAQKNYCSQNDGLFAVPTLVNERDEPVHGWFYQLLPYLDQVALHDRIDEDLAWNHSINRPHMQRVFDVALIHGMEGKTHPEGYGLIHFTLNERLFPNNLAFSEDYVSRADGLSNTILMGGISEGLPPWGAPGNARDPALGLEPSPETFGDSYHRGITFIGFADGRAMSISNDIDPAVLKALSTPDGGEEIPEDW